MNQTLARAKQPDSHESNGELRKTGYPYALAHTLMRMVKIAPQLVAWGTGAPAAAAAAA
jgi:hypothetical protein